MKTFFSEKKEPLNVFLANSLNISKTQIKKMLDQKKVFVNNRRVWIAGFLLKRGDKIEIIQDNLKNTSKKIKIAYEDDHYLIAVKTPGIITNGNNSLETILKKQINNLRLCAIHRLDKDTSGLVIFAKKQKYFEKIKNIFRNKKVIKIYRAIIVGKFQQNNLVIKKTIENRESTSKIICLNSSEIASYLEIKIETGRKHQIRIHLANIFHPVVGETIYNTKPVNNILLKSAPRQMLHAYKLEFENPYTHQQISVREKEPQDFQEMLKKLKIAC